MDVLLYVPQVSYPLLCLLKLGLHLGQLGRRRLELGLQPVVLLDQLFDQGLLVRELLVVQWAQLLRAVEISGH